MKKLLIVIPFFLLACSKAPQHAVALLESKSGSSVKGEVHFMQQKDGVLVHADVTGLSAGLHGFHIHETGDCSAEDASSAGGHFNPQAEQHGAPTAEHHHAGDFGNVVADETGAGKYERVLNFISLSGADSIIGKSVVVHADADDMASQPAGNSGQRVACGVVAKLKKKT